MAKKLRTTTPDTRIQQALADPKSYFEQARKRAEREVRAEMAREGTRLPTRRRVAT